MIKKAKRVNKLISEIVTLNEEIQSELVKLGINVYDKKFYAEEDDSVENKPNAFMVNMKVIGYDIDFLRNLEDGKL